MSYRPWGRLQPAAHRVRETGADPDVASWSRPALPFGNGRSYGDVCMNGEGELLAFRSARRILAFDPETGVLRAEGGTLLSEILDLVVPQGWFLPVTPGTKLVTLAGAIANDVHGKNHHVVGTFGRHVSAFELLRSDGERRVCTPDDAEPWFSATVGGLGLTGLITWAEIRLVPIAGRGMRVATHRFRNLEEYHDRSAAVDADHDYTVAWIDCLSRGAALGRGRLMAGNHAEAHEQRPFSPGRALNFFVQPPISLVNRLSLRAFNALYYRLPAKETAIVDFDPFFYPLDSIHNWNRMYGPKGFFQFQCVVPPEVGREAIRELLLQVGRVGSGSFLVVLKHFGDLASPGLMSFPRPGPTLALDLPNRGPATRRLMASLEAVVMEAGGALYPAKDACMSPETFEASYPRWRELEALRDPGFDSDFWRRVTGSTR